jgi:ABC-type spermidine/putrescine transport system permease subunit II
MTAVTVPRRVRRQRDPFRVLLGALTVVVLVFMFLPIGFVILHSFNKGGNFSIWAGGVSTRWWGDVFIPDKTAGTLILVAAIVIGTALIPVVARLVRRPLPPLLGRWLVPLGVLVAVLVSGWRTDWYRDLFNNPSLGDTLRNSFFCALGATIIAVILGAFAGVALARRPGWWTAPFLGVIFLVMVTPEIMDALALRTWMTKMTWLFSGNVFGLNAGYIRLWVGQSLYSSAIVTLIVRARLVGLDESLEEAAGDLGAPPGRAFRQITLPLISSALIAGALLSFTICLDNTIISDAIALKGTSTFPVFVIGTLHSTIRPSVAVAAVVLMGVTVLSLVLVGLVLKHSGDSSGEIAATLGGG